MITGILFVDFRYCETAMSLSNQREGLVGNIVQLRIKNKGRVGALGLRVNQSPDNILRIYIEDSWIETILEDRIRSDREAIDMLDFLLRVAPEAMLCEMLGVE